MVTQLLKLSAGLLIIACSGIVFLSEFVAHSSARVRLLLERAEQDWTVIVWAIIWATPLVVCCGAAAVAGLLLSMRALSQPTRTSARLESRP